VNEEHKSIQLEQKIIHLKSELEKYKTLLASFQSDQQRNHLQEQMEQLTTENAQLKEKCHDYEETISTQNHEIDRLSTELEETKKENRLLHNEIQELKNENLVLQQKVDANEKKIQSLLSDLSNYKQRQAELEKEKEIMGEKTQALERELSSHRALMNEYLSFKSQLESFTSLAERIKTMEKNNDFLKENIDKVFRDFEELKNVFFTQKQETEDLKEEVRILTKKFHTIEEMLSELDTGKQKDMAVLQKHILHQYVEIETLLEKTSHFATEIEKISKQLSELTEIVEQKNEDSPNSEMNEMKEMLSQLVQLLATQQEVPPVKEKPKEITPSQKSLVIKKQIENATPPPTNSFLKLQEFIDETQQSIVVSPVKKKGQSQMNPQTSNVYPQKTSKIKNVRVEAQPFQSTRQPFQHKQSGEDDDKSPNPVTPTLLYPDPQDDLSDIQSLTHTLVSDDILESTPKLKAATEEEPITHIEEKAAEQWITHPVMSKQAEEEIHDDIILIEHENPTAVQEEKSENIDDREIFEEIKSENPETESEGLDETNVSSPIESAAVSIMVENVQETLEIETNDSSSQEIQAAPPHPSAELILHDEPTKTSSQTQDKVLKNETTFLKAENESVEEDLENNKRGFFSLLKKAKIFK
jgi:septal ring factor EnvC (AmiA/AmiB activator)